jgi:type I restriction enzyme S subunit
MMRLKLPTQVIPQFVTLYCNSPDGKRQLTQNAKWAVNQASINQDDVLNALVPLPPIAEQQLIARKVEKLLKPAEVSNQRAKELSSKTEALESSLLADAFAG